MVAASYPLRRRLENTAMALIVNDFVP